MLSYCDVGEMKGDNIHNYWYKLFYSDIKQIETHVILSYYEAGEMKGDNIHNYWYKLFTLILNHRDTRYVELLLSRWNERR